MIRQSVGLLTANCWLVTVVGNLHEARTRGTASGYTQHTGLFAASEVDWFAQPTSLLVTNTGGCNNDRWVLVVFVDTSHL